MIIPGPYQYLGAFAIAFTAGVASAVAVITAIRLKPVKSN